MTITSRFRIAGLLGISLSIYSFARQALLDHVYPAESANHDRNPIGMIIACFAVSWAIVMIQEIRNIRNISRAITTSILIAVISIPAALGSSIGFTGDSALRASTILAGLIATSIGAVGLRTRVDQ